MSIINKIRLSFRYLRTAIWTLLTIEERIENLNVQLKILAHVKDNIFSFPYKAETIHLLLPLAGYDAIQNCIVSSGQFFEQSLLEKAAKYIPAGSVVADCGCNIGNHSVFFGKICKAQKVVSFDPQILCAQTCEKNMGINGLKDNAEVVCKALGKKNGFMKLTNMVPGNCGMARFSTDEKGTIPMTSIDEHGFTRLDFIKIDVEGGQLELLQGAEKTLKRFHPVIWVELLENDGSRGYDYEKEIAAPEKLLISMGYRMIERIAKDNFIYMWSSQQQPSKDKI